MTNTLPKTLAAIILTFEEIPTDVLEYFDDENPEQLIFGEHERRGNGDEQ